MSKFDSIDQADGGTEVNFDVNPVLGADEQAELLQILKEFSDVFALDPKKPTRTNLGEHIINTEGAQPVKQPLRRMPPRWEEEANRQVEEMLRNGICRPSKSPWNSSIVFGQEEGWIHEVCD